MPVSTLNRRFFKTAGGIYCVMVYFHNERHGSLVLLEVSNAKIYQSIHTHGTPYTIRIILPVLIPY